jgi:hypothetical protein
MVFKLLEAAQKSWRRLDGDNQLPKLVFGVTFNDGIESSPSRLTVSPKPPPRDRPSRHQNLAIARGAAARVSLIMRIAFFETNQTVSAGSALSAVEVITLSVWHT